MMNENKKRARIGCGVALVLFLVFVFVQLSYLGFALRLPAYEYGVSQYLVEQKKKSGKWPINLNGFPQSSQSAGAGRRTFHRNYFESIEIMQSDNKSCRFRLHLRGFWGFYPSRSIVEEETATVK